MYSSEQEAFKVKTGDTVSICTVVLAHPKRICKHDQRYAADASGKFLAEISFSNTDEENTESRYTGQRSFFSGASEQD